MTSPYSQLDHTVTHHVYHIKHPFLFWRSHHIIRRAFKALLCSRPPAQCNLQIESLHSILSPFVCLVGLSGNVSLKSIGAVCLRKMKNTEDAVYVSELSVKWI